jgi:hypothetical protein
MWRTRPHTGVGGGRRFLKAELNSRQAGLGAFISRGDISPWPEGLFASESRSLQALQLGKAVSEPFLAIRYWLRFVLLSCPPGPFWLGERQAIWCRSQPLREATSPRRSLFEGSSKRIALKSVLPCLSCSDHLGLQVCGTRMKRCVAQKGRVSWSDPSKRQQQPRRPVNSNRPSRFLLTSPLNSTYIT